MQDMKLERIEFSYDGLEIAKSPRRVVRVPDPTNLLVNGEAVHLCRSLRLLVFPLTANDNPAA
jgi:hypothetical protein